MIIAYADDTEPLIIRIESDGRPVWEECYSCTGSGYEIAMAYLCQKDYDERMPLMECLARVFMAKKMAQKNPYVGNESSFDILINGDGNSSRRVLTDDGWRYLRENASQKDNFHALVFNEEFLAAKRAGRQKSEAILSIDHR